MLGARVKSSPLNMTGHSLTPDRKTSLCITTYLKKKTTSNPSQSGLASQLQGNKNKQADVNCGGRPQPGEGHV